MAPTGEFTFRESVSQKSDSAVTPSNIALPPSPLGTAKLPGLFDKVEDNGKRVLPAKHDTISAGASGSEVAFLRDQIFENVKMAFPVLCKNKSDDIDFMIGLGCTKGLFNSFQYRAFVALGLKRVRVVEGSWGDNMLQAYENLLGATAEMLERLEFRMAIDGLSTTRKPLTGLAAFYTVDSK